MNKAKTTISEREEQNFSSTMVSNSGEESGNVKKPETSVASSLQISMMLGSFFGLGEF